MPGGGIAAAWEITARLPAVKVVMLTVSSDDYDLFAALRAGASGYLLKGTSLEALPGALRSVLAGEAALSPELVTRIVEEFRDRAPRRRRVIQLSADAQLTSREWEVLDLLRHRFTTAQIARRLYVSPATVRSHVAAVLRKLRVPDRDAAVRLFEAS
jgi:DNA-binding NarL/FixJ family response regulator